MAKDKVHNLGRAMSSPTVIWYAVAASLLGIYAIVNLLAGLRHPIAPMARILLLLFACVFAYLGARLPRRGEITEPTVHQMRVRRVMWLCFILYLHLVLTFTLFDPGMGRNFFQFLHATAQDRAEYMRWHINFTPLQTIRTVYWNGYRNGYITLGSLLLNLAGNLLVFAPLAFFLPYLFTKINSFFKFLPITLASVLAVELCQLALMCGSCDIDDVLLNMGGALVTYILLQLPPVKHLVAVATLENRCQHPR